MNICYMCFSNVFFLFTVERPAYAFVREAHMHIESALIEALGAEGARVHSARSRNDQVALDIPI